MGVLRSLSLSLNKFPISIKPSEWYHVSRKWVADKVHPDIMKRFPTLESMLRLGYPEYPWESSMFRTRSLSSRGNWGDVGYKKQLLETIGKALGVKEVIKKKNTTHSSINIHALNISCQIGTVSQRLRWPTKEEEGIAVSSRITQLCQPCCLRCIRITLGIPRDSSPKVSPPRDTGRTEAIC